MEDNTKAMNKGVGELIKIELRGKEVNIPIFYNVRSYKTYNKVLIQTNDYKEAFLSTIYEMISRNEDTINLHNVIIDDVKVLKIEDLEKIAEHIVNSSGIIDELKKSVEFNNSDCFQKMYLMNKKMVKHAKEEIFKINDGLKLVRREFGSLTESINIPTNSAIKLTLASAENNIKQLAVTANSLSNANIKGLTNQFQKSLEPLKTYSMLGLLNIQEKTPKVALATSFATGEGFGKNYSQYLNIQTKVATALSPSMKSMLGISGQMGNLMSPINASVKIAIESFQSNINKSLLTSNNFSNLSSGITNQLQKQLEPLRDTIGLRLLDMQKTIPKIGLDIGFASQALKLHSSEFNKIISNINSTREVLINSNIQGIRSVLLETQVGSKLLESQLKGVKESLNLATKFNFENKLVSFESLNKSILKGIKPFFTDFNSIILSRSSFTESIKSKALSMNAFGWWLISSLPITIINEIDRKKDSLNIDEVDCIICSYFSENDFRELDKIVERWEDLDYVNSRIDILKESIEVHELGKYKLTVPTLVPLIEGVIREFMSEKYKIFNESFNPTYKIFKGKVEELSNFISSYVIVCIDELYCRFSPTNPSEVSDFSRHKISHGLSTEYGSEANSLKVILFLDEIFEIISSIKEMKLIEVG